MMLGLWESKTCGGRAGEFGEAPGEDEEVSVASVPLLLVVGVVLGDPSLGGVGGTEMGSGTTLGMV
jgi:hypothetical protein